MITLHDAFFRTGLLTGLLVALAAASSAQDQTPGAPASAGGMVVERIESGFLIAPDTKFTTVNDDFAGRAPDLGALEVGKPEPRYGPRWLKGQPFYR